MSPLSFAPALEEPPRSSYLGGPDAAAILGLNPWKSPWDVLAEKRGLTPPLVPSWPMKAGLALEPVILADYAERENVEVVSQPGVAFHPRHPWAGGHPDGVVPARPLLLEVKTTQSDDAWGAPGTDEIPDHIHCQVSWYLAICDLPAADVLVLVRNRTLLTYHVERNTILEDELFAECGEWWERYVVRGEEPEFKSQDGNAHGYLEARWRENKRPLVKSTPEIDQLAYELRNVRAQAADLKAREGYIADAIRAFIADADGVQTIHGDITWKRSKDTPKTDWHALATALGVPMNVLAQYTQTVPGSRRFVVPRSWKTEGDDE